MTFAKAWVRAGLAVGLSLGLSLGLAIAAGVAPASAADWGGIKDTGGGVPVPVPAPEPVPTYDWDSDWYIGGTIGAIISQNATINDSDIGNLGGVTPGVFGRDSGDIGDSPIFGLSFGRYITPSLRAEIAIDYTPDAQISSGGAIDYQASNSAYKYAGGVQSIDTNNYAISRTDTVKLARTTGLINLLYDIPTGTRFTPYIGGGVGFSWRSLRRTYSEDATCISASNSIAGTYNPPGSCSGNASLPSGNVSGSNTKQQIDLAAAVQAGIAYDLTDSITWDNGWQMLWEGGAIASTEPSAAGENTITYKDAVLQQFRSGIRIKFN
jgi:opacity protein-like surface antigen